MKGALMAVLGLLVAACGPRKVAQSEWERSNESRLSREQAEAEVVTQFPAYPRKANLLEFRVGGTGEFAFFIDKGSLSVGSDGIVRYVMVARSSDGVDNVSYEGLRCESAEVRRYAAGQPDATWRVSPGLWQPIARRWHLVLHREYFCPQNVALHSAAEGVRALQAGGHPFSRGFSADPNRVR